METDFTCSYLFSVATRNVKVLNEARIVFLLAGAARLPLHHSHHV